MTASVLRNKDASVLDLEDTRSHLHKKTHQSGINRLALFWFKGLADLQIKGLCHFERTNFGESLLGEKWREIEAEETTRTVYRKTSASTSACSCWLKSHELVFGQAR